MYEIFFIYILVMYHKETEDVCLLCFIYLPFWMIVGVQMQTHMHTGSV